MTGTKSKMSDYHDKIDYERVNFQLITSGLHRSLPLPQQPVHQLPFHVWRFQEIRH